MPGGNSRTTTFFDPYPFYIQRGQGAHIWDADGIERVDFNGNYTSLILGHAPPDVVKAVQAVAELGLSFPGPTEHEVRLAEIIVRRVPVRRGLRFTNSGTEATMNAVRLARAFTGRPKLAKFEGAFHGTHDWVHGERDRRHQVVGQSPPAQADRVVGRHAAGRAQEHRGAAVERSRGVRGDSRPRKARAVAAVIVDPYMCNARPAPAGGRLPARGCAR